tara:strand:- start:4106 stop:4504 length:399 start_codon:yes stop_codon:yes gene_type:complete
MEEQTNAIKRLEQSIKKMHKKNIRGVFLENELITHSQNDLLTNVAKLQETLDAFVYESRQKIIGLKREISILTQLFIHGDDIKTYDLSTTFPEAYNRIIELEKVRATAKSFYESSDDSEFNIEMDVLKNKEI